MAGASWGGGDSDRRRNRPATTIVHQSQPAKWKGQRQTINTRNTIQDMFDPDDMFDWNEPRTNNHVVYQFADFGSRVARLPADPSLHINEEPEISAIDNRLTINYMVASDEFQFKCHLLHEHIKGPMRGRMFDTYIGIIINAHQLANLSPPQIVEMLEDRFSTVLSTQALDEIAKLLKNQ